MVILSNRNGVKNWLIAERSAVRMINLRSTHGYQTVRVRARPKIVTRYFATASDVAAGEESEWKEMEIVDRLSHPSSWSKNPLRRAADDGMNFARLWTETTRAGFFPPDVNLDRVERH